jgi:hypothetical protein
VTARDSRLPSYAAGQDQDDEDQQHESEASTRAIAPAPAVPPVWQRPEEREDQDDNENRCKHQLPLREVLAVSRFAGTVEMVGGIRKASRSLPTRPVSRSRCPIRLPTFGLSSARGETRPDFMVPTLGDTLPPRYWTLVQWKPYRPRPGLGTDCVNWSRARSASALRGVRPGPVKARDQPSTPGLVTERGRRGYAVPARRLPPAAMPPPGTPEVNRGAAPHTRPRELRTLVGASHSPGRKILRLMSPMRICRSLCLFGRMTQDSIPGRGS